MSTERKWNQYTCQKCGNDWMIFLEEIPKLCVECRHQTKKPATNKGSSENQMTNLALNNPCVRALRALAALPIEDWDGQPDDTAIYSINDTGITIGNVKDARRALATLT